MKSTDNVKRIAELNALFLTLDNKGQDSALTILRSLGFAQSVMDPPKPEPYTANSTIAERGDTNVRDHLPK